jgi:hypothetical protein
MFTLRQATTDTYCNTKSQSTSQPSKIDYDQALRSAKRLRNQRIREFIANITIDARI